MLCSGLNVRARLPVAPGRGANPRARRYIDRLISKRKIVLDSLNVHRLVVTSVMLAAKFFDDMYLDNQHYAAVGGVPKIEMNILELEFLFLLEFNLFVTTADYDMYRSALHAKLETSAPNMAQTQQPLSPWGGGAGNFS
jgi:hypothetical protein